jgi:hypothetical protein
MGWKIVDEKFPKVSIVPSGAHEVTVSGNSISDAIVFTQGKNVICIDTKQFAAIQDRMIVLGAVKPTVYEMN